MLLTKNTPICLYRYGRQCQFEQTKSKEKYCLKEGDCKYKEKGK